MQTDTATAAPAFVEHLRTAVPKMRFKRFNLTDEVTTVVLPVERLYLGTEPTDKAVYAGPNPTLLVGDEVLDAWLDDFDNDQLSLDFDRLVSTLPSDIIDAILASEQGMLTVNLVTGTVTFTA